MSQRAPLPDRLGSVCECGHPWEAHELVEGWTCSPGVTIDGRSSVPDIWVCSGGRLADVNDPDVSPWDFVCGCILHKEPEAVREARQAAVRERIREACRGGVIGPVM